MPVSEPDGECRGNGYWKNNNRYAANENQNTPWPVHEDSNMCATTWYQMINEPARGDAWNILGSHFVSAKLNESNIGSVPQSIADAMLQAQTLLSNCSISDGDRDYALALKDQLETFVETDNCELVEEPTEPVVPPVDSSTATVHIHSIYDVDGEDRSKLSSVLLMAIPSLLPMSQRDERFVRVLIKNQEDQWVINGYADIQPDGSVIFDVPAQTPYTFEVVNKHGKALNQASTQGGDFDYDYLQRHNTPLQVAAGEVQQCHGCHIEGSDYDHANESGEPVNRGALNVMIPWPSANPFILSAQWGDTMAEALYDSIENVGALTPAIEYVDHWALLPFRQSPAISLGFDELQTQAPISVACENELTADCTANINYSDHIQPLWNVSRDEDGNSCVDCHDNRGFTNLDLSDFQSNPDGQLTSYNALFNSQRSYMFLAASFSEVNSSHCRTDIQPPFLMEPQNDCFSCFEQILMNTQGALSSANFFDMFEENAADTNDDHWLFRPTPLSQEVRDQHQGMLAAQERKLIAEWIDMGAAR